MPVCRLGLDPEREELLGPLDSPVGSSNLRSALKALVVRVVLIYPKPAQFGKELLDQGTVLVRVGAHFVAGLML